MSIRTGFDEEEEKQQGRWEDMPQELLWNIIKRVEESETCWPSRLIQSCASVCKSWRAITKEVVETPEQSGRLTFPISLKQPGPRDSHIQCYIRRNRETSTFMLYLGPEPSENKKDKLLLVAKRKRRMIKTKYDISLVADDFRRTSKSCIGKLRSSFFKKNKFTIHETQPSPPPQHEATAREAVQPKKVFVRHKYNNVGTIQYNTNVVHKCRFHRVKGPRRMKCVMNKLNSPSLSSSSSTMAKEPLLKIKSKDPTFDEHCQHWHLNFRHESTLASDNFQLIFDDENDDNEQEQEKVILEFSKIGEDVFVMDYCYPLSAFQAFAICLSNFDAKPTCDD